MFLIFVEDFKMLSTSSKLLLFVYSPVPLVALPKASVYGHSPAGIEASNPAVGMDVFCECCLL
jgi:hypothetical protein